MPVIDSTERSKFRALIIGGYLEDIEISGIQRRDKTNSRRVRLPMWPTALSLISADVLFLSCLVSAILGNGLLSLFRSRRIVHTGLSSLEVLEIIAVEKPSIVSINDELLNFFVRRNSISPSVTLEIGHLAASKAASVESRIKVIDPSPFHELKGLEGLEKYDFILANDYMSFDRDDRRVIIKASSKGARYGKKEYLPPRIGKSRFGSGDLFGAIFSLLVSTGTSPEEAIEESVKISGEYCYQGKSIGQFLLGIRDSLDYVIRS